MVVGLQVSETPVMVGGAAVTVMVAEPDVLVYPDCVELALQLAFPAADGVNTPPEVMVPPVAVHVTVEVKAPVPLTAATQVEVCAVVMEEGVATTVTLVTVGGGAVMVTVAFPDLVASSVEVAVTMSDPEAGTAEVAV
jgi:hypothetical protein